MIARIWRGVTPEGKADEYVEYLNETGLPDYRSTKGNQGVWMLRRIKDGQAEFVLMSLWDSYESIAAFAGDDIEKARYYPEDEAFLLELEPEVLHYEVLAH